MKKRILAVFYSIRRQKEIADMYPINKIKRETALLLLAMGVLIQGAPSFSESSLKDVKTHWSKPYVERLYKEGYVVGNNGYFNPNTALKTEDFLIMALKVVDPSSKDLKAAEGEVYYKPFIDRAIEIGLIKAEYDEVPHYVNRMMPRELAVQVIDRAIAMKGESVTADHGLEYKFKDYSIINDVNKEAVLKAYQLGIIKGSNGNFEPKNPLTRAEAAVLISKLMDKTLRDKLTFSINSKVFDEVSEWYMNGYDAITGRRTVVIEKKADGSINNGGKDYFETRKWWSDQEFENLVNSTINTKLPSGFSNAIAAPSNPNLNVVNLYVQGGFFARNGEITLVDTYNNGTNNPTAHKFYDAEIDNLNRMIYDLAKYTVQFAKENGKFANIEYLGSGRVVISYQDTARPDTIRFSTLIFLDSIYTKEDYKLKNRCNLNFEYDGFNWKKDEIYIKQVVYRLYGKEKGAKAFEFIKANLKDRTVNSTGEFSKISNGIWYQLRDSDFKGPWLYSYIE